MTTKTTLADPAEPTAAIIYTRPGCGPCGATVRRFEALDISYETRDLTKHLADADRLRRAGHLQAPVIEPTNSAIKPWSGFRPIEIASLALTSRTH